MTLEEHAQLHLQLQRLARTEDPAVAAALATELLVALREVQSAVSAVRDDAVQALHARGESLQDIGRTARLTRGRVFQIVQRTRRTPATDGPSLAADER